LDRVNRLKQSFAANPNEAIPELQYLIDHDWLEFVTYEHSQIEPDNSGAMARARRKAQIHFAKSELSNALQQYGKNNNGQFPTDLSQLVPYFTAPVDPSVFMGWEILPTSSLPREMRVDGDWVITQKAPTNGELGQRVVVSMKGLWP